MSKASDKKARSLADELVEAGLVGPSEANAFIPFFSVAFAPKKKKKSAKK